MSHDSMRPKRSEIAILPNADGEIDFAAHMADELLLIVQQNVRMSKGQSALLERAFKRYLNQAL